METFFIYIKYNNIGYGCFAQRDGSSSKSALTLQHCNCSVCVLVVIAKLFNWMIFYFITTLVNTHVCLYVPHPVLLILPLFIVCKDIMVSQVELTDIEWVGT